MCDICNKKTKQLNVLQCLQHKACHICFGNIQVKDINLVTGLKCPVCKSGAKYNDDTFSPWPWSGSEDPIIDKKGNLKVYLNDKCYILCDVQLY